MSKVTIPTLQPYEPTFQIDDGFRLTSEMTLDAVCNDVRHWHAFSLRGADMHMLGAFLCGLSLLRARDMVPKAKRGMHGKADKYDGFHGWKRQSFPEIYEGTLGRYMNFAEAVFTVAKKSKNGTLPFLEKGPSHFELPTTHADLAVLMAELGNAMEGRTMTELYRSIKRIREATPAGGDRGNHTPRRTGFEVGMEQARDIVNGAYPRFEHSVIWWQTESAETLDLTPVHYLDKDQLDHLYVQLGDLREEIKRVRSLKK
jgi:hypothetical protein